MRTSFFEHFWVTRGGGYLGDVWRDGMLDQSVRPNQILAVSLPYPVLEEQHQPQVVECVRNKLLTPFGLRTLSPDDPGYRGRYEGGPASRDAAYHQGTVWPWLLGHYTDALLRVAWDVDGAVQALLDPGDRCSATTSRTRAWQAFPKFSTPPRPTGPTAALPRPGAWRSACAC